jgi:preprotein translocase subunit YajC
MLIIYVVAFIAIFYFMAIRPQQKQRRAHAALLSSLKKGDTIVTAAGIYGKVKRVEDNLVVVEVAKGVSMKISRRAVVEIISEGAQAKALAPEGTGGGKGKRSAEIEESTADDVEAEATEVADEAEQDSTDSET